MRERLVSTECRACGVHVDYAGVGRRPRYCSDACRQRDWALRTAAADLEQGDPRPAVVREVVAREHVRTVRVAGKAPSLPEHWTRHLDTLTAQLSDPASTATTVFWHHGQLAHALGQALLALDRAHPGGLDWDQLPVRPDRQQSQNET